MHKKPNHPTEALEYCPSVRLAASDLVSVDRCSCGNLRVRLGALTLRVTPDGLHSILHTLAEALAENAALAQPPQPMAAMATSGLRGFKPTRGQS